MMKAWLMVFLNWAAMGGYATYVWSAYGATFSIIFISLIRQRCQWQRLYKRVYQQSRSL